MTKKEMVVEIVKVAPIPLEKSKVELTNMLLNDCSDINVEKAYKKLESWNYDIMACWDNCEMEVWFPCYRWHIASIENAEY